jgi:hypothetical protein
LTSAADGRNRACRHWARNQGSSRRDQYG